ncbi:hypothetical protein GCM10028791_16140 [Echinicola sediminis]
MNIQMKWLPVLTALSWTGCVAKTPITTGINVKAINKFKKGQYSTLVVHNAVQILDSDEPIL